MAVYFQDLTLVALSSCGALSMLVGALFKKFSLFLNMRHMSFQFKEKAEFSINQ